MLRRLVAYKRWANEITYADVASLPEAAAQQRGATKWGSMAYTLSHVWTVDDIFRHHVTGRAHGYSQRNLDAPLPLTELRDRQRDMDQWWIDYVDAAAPKEFYRVIDFTFVGGGAGAMRIDGIIVHIVNHATYHRGMVSAMLYDHGVSPRANDYPVYIRDVPEGIA